MLTGSLFATFLHPVRSAMRTAIVRLVNDIYHIQRSLLRLETSIRTKQGKRAGEQDASKRIFYIWYAKRAHNLMDSCTAALLKIKNLKESATSDERRVLGNMEGLAIKLVNCCGEFAHVCYSIDPFERDPSSRGTFTWESKIWKRYKRYTETYQEKARDFKALWKAEMES